MHWHRIIALPGSKPLFGNTVWSPTPKAMFLCFTWHFAYNLNAKLAPFLKYFDTY